MRNERDGAERKRGEKREKRGEKREKNTEQLLDLSPAPETAKSVVKQESLKNTTANQKVNIG